MICEPCRAGKKMVKVTETNADGTKSVRTHQGHKLCKGGTWCDCQHKEPLRKLPLPAEDC